MELLRDLLKMITEESKAPKSTAAKIYHRDYLKTRKEPYRKYTKKKK